MAPQGELRPSHEQAERFANPMRGSHCRNPPRTPARRCESCTRFGRFCSACSAAAGCSSCPVMLVRDNGRGYCKEPGAISPACTALGQGGSAKFLCGSMGAYSGGSRFVDPGCTLGCTTNYGCKSPASCPAGSQFVRPCSSVGLCIDCKVRAGGGGRSVPDGVLHLHAHARLWQQQQQQLMPPAAALLLGVQTMGCPGAKCTSTGCPACPKGKFKMHVGDKASGFDICVL